MGERYRRWTIAVGLFATLVGGAGTVGVVRMWVAGRAAEVVYGSARVGHGGGEFLVALLITGLVVLVRAWKSHKPFWSPGNLLIAGIVTFGSGALPWAYFHVLSEKPNGPAATFFLMCFILPGVILVGVGYILSRLISSRQ